MSYFGILRHVALVRSDVSEEYSASIISVTKIGELGTTFTVTSNRRRLLKKYYVFSIVRAVKTSNLTYFGITSAKTSVHYTHIVLS
jgi:hypothetical protein